MKRATRLQRAWLWWLALPEVARLAMLIVAVVAAARLVGWLTP